MGLELPFKRIYGNSCPNIYWHVVPKLGGSNWKSSVPIGGSDGFRDNQEAL